MSGHVQVLAEGARLLAILAIWIGLVVALIRDTMPSVTWEWRLTRGAMVACGVATAVAFFARHWS